MPIIRTVSHALAGLILLALCSTAAMAEAAFRRGLGLHTMMNWAVVAQPPATYAWAPFSSPAHDVSDDVLARIADSGFDFVRLTIDPGPFLTFMGKSRASLDEMLLSNIARIGKHGLSVVVDFHPNRQVPRFDPIALLKDEDSALFSAYVDMIARTASLLADIDDVTVAIEPFNEPPYGYNPTEIARWHRMLARLHTAARAASPDLPIIVSGARGGSIRGLLDIDPAAFSDDHTLFSFHFYEPFAFTHQGVTSNNTRMRHMRYMSSLPYPAAAGDPDAVWEGIRLAIDADATLGPSERLDMQTRAREALDAYLASRADAQSIADEIDTVAQWAAHHAIPHRRIFMGEFGAVRTFGRFRGADAVSHAVWLSDVRMAAEARGFVWSFWSLRSYGGMALLETHGSNAFHVPTLRALGLEPHKTQARGQ